MKGIAVAFFASSRPTVQRLSRRGSSIPRLCTSLGNTPREPVADDSRANISFVYVA